MKDKLKKVMIFSAILWMATNFHHPVTPSHFTTLGLPSHVFGTSYAMMVFGSFLSGPVWGSWGDRHSRIKVIVISTLIYGLSQIGFGYSTSLGAILFFRGLSGVANGGFGGALMAAIVDTSTIENRRSAMSNYTALMLISSSLGYLIGGILGYYPPQYVIYTQGIVIILISFGFKYIVGETQEFINNNSDKKIVFIWDILKDKERTKELFDSKIIIFLALTFFIFIAYSSNLNAFNYYLKEQLNLKPIVNGVWKALTGIIGLVANLTINVWLFRKKDIKKSLMGLIALATLSAIMIVLNTSFYPFMIWNLLFFTLHAIQLPILQNFAVQGNSNDVGFMSGVYSAVRALGEVVGATVAGFAYNISSLAPFIVSSIALFIALIFSFLENKTDKKIKPN